MGDRYEVSFEIAGPLAMFARPDTGGTPTSYPVPTWAAVKGMFEAIAWLESGDAWIDPLEVEVCRPIGTPGGEVRFQRYTTNYGGPLRKPSQIAAGASYQLIATVLADVCYRVHGVVRGGQHLRAQTVNCRHYLQHLFNRRLRQGRCHRTPCLGWSEFTAAYWGPFRNGADGREPETERDTALNLHIPSLLHQVFTAPVGGAYGPRFLYNKEIREGLLSWSDLEARDVA